MSNALYIGIMSGTSLDAVDIALLNFNHNSSLGYQLIDKNSIPIPQKLKKTLFDLNFSGHITHEIKAAKQSEFELTKLYAKAYQALIEKHSDIKDSINAIGAHGQTIRHEPNTKTPYSYQLLNGALLSELCKKTVICDFRSKDIAVSGQGAPLAPVFHQVLFKQLSMPYAIVNLGGIANISFVSEHGVLGFDCGPANCLMDSWIKKYKGKGFDENGRWAQQGSLIPELLAKLMNDPYIQLPPPKSTGRDYFSLSWLMQKLTGEEQEADVMYTLLHYTAKSLVKSIPKATNHLCFCGGGSHNKALISIIKYYLSSNHSTQIIQSPIDAQFIEAAGFAYLASQTFNQKPINSMQTTGAIKPVILGATYYY